MEWDKIAIIINTQEQLTEFNMFLPHATNLPARWFILNNRGNNYFALTISGNQWFYLGKPGSRTQITFDEWKLLRTVGVK